MAFVQRKWHSQDDLLRTRDRTIEKNIRMLCGQQWSIWSPVLGRYVDLTHYLSDDERRWRQRPVVDRLLGWFMLTHARLTENQPIITFQPSTLDRHDAELAEVADTLFKTAWRTAGMEGVHDALVSWLIPGGAAYLKSRIDTNGGELKSWRGDAVLSMDSPQGPIERPLSNVPYGPDGQPAFVRGEDDQVEMDGDEPRYGPAFSAREGAIAADPLSCLEVRGQWGANIEWHRKRWHIHRSYMTPEEVLDRYGVECEPDIIGADAEGLQELNRILFGTGYFGAAHNANGSEGMYEDPEGYCEVLEYWEAPCRLEGMQETEDSPGGRLTAVTRTTCLRDGPRWARFPYTSPIRQFEFVKLPGRPHGSTPQERMNPVQQTYNRGWAQILEHRNRATNPILWYDKRSGIEKGDITNRPGLTVGANLSEGGKPPLGFVSPGQLSDDVYKIQALLKQELDDQGHIPGGEGRPPTADPSGELVAQLRFNSDRPSQPTARRMVAEYARMAEDWLAIMPLIYDEERVLHWTGDDQVTRAVTVYPDLFKDGKVNVIPDLESMMPESRSERQARVTAMWKEGAFGDPLSPPALRKYFELARFPHMGRTAGPGGIDAVTAQQENGKLVRGTPAAMIPVLEWYDHEVHLYLHYEFMKAPEYIALPLPVQQAFVDHTEEHKAALALAMQLQQPAPDQGAGGGAPDAGGGPDTASAPVDQPVKQIAPPVPPGA